jgi:cell division protein FtsA
MENYIFALDIGTRSVVGILLKVSGEQFEFVDLEYVEHQERAMLNGQIHNAPLVSKVVKKVKERLEERNNLILKKTSVAAAGRSLVTRKESIEEEFQEDRFVSKEDITRLKLRCVHKAQYQLKMSDPNKEYNNYYCVGYSVRKSFLDDIELGNLEGQKGKKIAVEIVAAFLPKIVLESLKYVVEDNDLILENLTLEPIAAINAIIPSTMRKLNLVLVDIGAGTSDIAISSEGAINAYGMVPMAGDEITEKISTDYLLDFNEAERVKRLIKNNEEIEFKDVLGFVNSVKSDDLLKTIEPVALKLSSEIAETILQLNGKAPQAVVLIGGGSLTPNINAMIAQNLGLPENRVAVQSARSINDVINIPEEYKGPEYITPVGIALTYRNDSNLGFIQVMVNDYPVSVLNLGANTAFDALLSAGIPSEKIYPKAGDPKTIKINGKVKIIPGTSPLPSEILINEEPGKIESFIQPDDFITFIPGEEGSEGRVFLKDIVPEQKKVFFEDKEIILPLEIIVDGTETEDLNTELKDNSNVTVRTIDSAGELMGLIDSKYLGRIDYNISTDNNLRFKSLNRYDFIINGTLAGVNYRLENGDNIQAMMKNHEEYVLKNVLKEEIEKLEKKYITVTLDEEPVKIIISDYEIYHNNTLANLEDKINDGDYINIKISELKQPLLIDLFKEINFTPKAPEGLTKVEVLLNGEEAEYISPIHDGDEVSIIWR